MGLFLPLLGFLLISSLSFYLNRKTTAFIACSTILFSFLFFGIFLLKGHYPTEEIIYRWIPVVGIDAHFSLVLDTLSLLMSLIITGIGFIIHLYSIGYMDHEEDYSRYFACLNFFIFSMLLLVLSADLILFFVGWEGVGLASYLLIGFWYQKNSAASAATKAFVVNRIGDWGLLIGILLILKITGNSNIEEILEKAKIYFAIGAPIISIITFLLFWGACGKSAQFPLHVWLPDAMEGPTPVSALIHAATMVTAGVYLIVRLEGLFLLSPMTMIIICTIGALTSLFAALSAMGQTDLKRVLAYSTMSQLGLMFVSCGIGAFYAAMFHLMTHAFIKALLFLSAGNIIHMLNGVTQMNEMGGLKKDLPKTNLLFLIGVIAMAGVPPFAAFFSKELIIEEEYLVHANLLFYGTWIISILTGYYLMRAYILTFYGEKKYSKPVFEAPNIMWMPLILLALLSLFGGAIGVSFNNISSLERFLDESDVITSLTHSQTTFHFSIVTFLSAVAIGLGLFLAIYLFRTQSNLIFHPPYILKKSFYIDKIYQYVVVSPLKKISSFIVLYTEPFFEKMMGQTANGMQTIGKKFQVMQSGQIRSYGAWMAIGTAFLLLYLVIH